LQKKENAILNKVYTRHEYEKLVSKVAEHMKESGELGEFFPLSASPHPYNRSMAQRYFPMRREEVSENGLRWYDQEIPRAENVMNSAELPDDLPTNNSPIVAKSERSGFPFLISGQEIARLRKMSAPLPRLTYDERMNDRALRMGGIHLNSLTCQKSGQTLRCTAKDSPGSPVWSKEVFDSYFFS
jgi:hypothetical protein